MRKRVVIIQGHPDPSGERFCHSLANRVAEGASSAGAEVIRIEVGQLAFPILRTQDDFNRGAAGTPETLIPARDAISFANHIVIIYPLWHGTMPALLKAFFEQTLRPGVALEYTDKHFPKKLLAGKSARIIVTMGMPALAYRWYFCAHSLRSLKRNILGISGVKPIRSSVFGSVESVSDETRKKWLDKIRETAGRDVR